MSISSLEMNSTTKRPIQIQRQASQQQQTPVLKHGNSFNQNAVPVKGHYRKTSAEIVSEAKTMLAGGPGGGVRLVSTRRPITPREPRRQLYGKLAPPGRPPSAFSLRYLQFESRALPSLEPIQQQQQQQVLLEGIPLVPRAGSVETLLDYVGATNNNNTNVNNSSNITNNHARLQGKLPALLSPPKITASLDNLSDEIPPHPDLLRQKDEENNSENNVTAGPKTNSSQYVETQNQRISSSKEKSNSSKSNLLRSRQTKSFDVGLSGPDSVPLKEKVQSKGGVMVNRRKDSPARSNFPSRTCLTRSNDLLAQSTTETLLDLLKAHTGIKECSEETVLHVYAILVELYTRVKGAKGNWRGAILGGLYGLVECSSPKILLAVARVVLALCVTGSNLTGACKLVFKVARSETNDHLFADSNVPELLIDGLGRASPMDEPEACIYGYGAVRFLASAIQQANTAPNLNGKPPFNQVTNKQKSIAQRLARHGAVQLMVLHLQILNEVGAVQKLSGPPLHALFQLSAALRALAGIPQVIVNSVNLSKSLVTTTSLPEGNFPIIKETMEIQDINLELACPHLVKAAEICIGDPEVQANIVRTLSVMSEHDACCESMSLYAARIGILLGPCKENTIGVPEKPLALLSRLGYILGNIMAKFDSAREQFYANDVAMEYLLEALNIYSKQKLTISNQMGDTVLDVIIKLVRVVANMSVNADVGHNLGRKSPLGLTLHHILITVNQHTSENMTPEMEELLQATLGALHNLCFYHEDGDASSAEDATTGSMCDQITGFSVALCDTLNLGSESVRAEAARVLGNMTRKEAARESFCSAGGLKAIVRCLGSQDYELAATSCGVLVNLLGDWERRAPFRELKGPQLLRDILQKAAIQEDWPLAGIVCQALWNYLIDSGNIIGALGEDEVDYIAGNLAEYLDEERIFNGQPADSLWEQFATVATDLLERIQSSMSYGNTPCCSSDEEEDDIITSNQINSDEISVKWRANFKRWLQQ